MTFKVKDGISIAGTTFVDGSRNISIGTLNGNTPIHSGNYSSYAAPISHTHDYLPLSGGTVTGDLLVQGGSSRFPSHFFHYEYDSAGNIYEHYYAPGSENVKNSTANLRVSSTSGYYKTLSFSGDGNFAWNGNTVLTAGNYTSYAAKGTGTTGGADLNTLTTSGMYRIQENEANRPGNYGQLLVIHGGSDTITQIYGQYNDGTLYTRSGNPSNVGGGGSWTSWRTLLDSSNYTSYAASASHTHSYLPLTGGTLTGLETISVNNSTNTTTTGSHLRLENPTGSQSIIGFTFAGTAKSSLRADGDGNLIINASNNAYYFNYELGTSSFNFRNGAVGIFQSISGTTVNFPGALQQGGNQVLHAANYTSYAVPLSNGTATNLTLGARVNSSSYGGNTSGMSSHSFPVEIRANGAKPTLTWHYESVATRHIALDADGALNLYNPGESGGAVFKVGSNTALHGGNYSSYALPLSGGTLSGDVNTNANFSISGRSIRPFENNSFIEFYVGGDANTYYPVRFDVYAWYHWGRWSISRGYGDTAPWDPIGTGAHRGGLTFTWEWSGDGAWGGNDHNLRVVQFSEQYTTMVGGMALSVNGMIVWLRGGSAYYRFHGPGGIMNSATPYYSTFTASNGATYSPRSYDSNTVASEVNSRFSVRDGGTLYESNQRVLNAGNYSSYALPLGGGTLSGTLIVNGGSNSIIAQDNGGSGDWRGRILSKNSTYDRAAFLGTYAGNTGVFAHNHALNAWADLYVNTSDGSGGGTVRMPSSVLINGSQAVHAGNVSSYAWERTGGWKPTSLSGATRQVGIASPDGGEFALAYASGQTYAYIDGWFYQNEGQYRVLDTQNYSSYALPLSGGTVSGRTTFADGLRIGPTPGDPNAYIISRTMPAGDPNAVNEGTELLLFHSNDNANGSGPDYITLRAPAIRFQTYDNSAVGDPDASAGWNNRLSISPAGLVTIHGDRPVTINTGNGSVFSKGSSGGWGMGHLFYGSSGTYRGGFGALGGADSLSYYWVGQDYNDATLYVYPGTKVVAQRDLIVNGRTGGNYGNRIIVGADDTSYTMQDTNLRPTVHLHGQYPVLSLNHTVTSNGNHGPTVQFTSNGTGNQFVIGTNGTGTQLDMGYSANTDWNPHNGIAGYNGTTFFRANTSGYIGLGALGDWGDLGGGSPGYNLHFKGANNGSGGYAAVFENIANAVTGGGFLFQNNYGNHSYGIVAEFRVGSASGSDRPSILFSSPLASTTWSVGYGYYDDQFRIKQNHGHRSSDWGTERFRIDTGGTPYFNGNVALHAANYGSYALPLSGGTTTGIVNITGNGNTGSNNNVGLNVYATGGNGANMAFHRSGYYAINMGLDSDNVFRIGGWSAGANRWQLDMAGNGTYAGNVTAYSDERLKKDWAQVSDNFVEHLAQIKSGTYTRIDSEERQAGVSAQDFQKLLPETVSEDNSGTLSLAYGNAALVSAVELAKEVTDLRARVAQLENLISKLLLKD